MATINSGIDPLKAQEIMIEFDIDLEVVAAQSAEEAVSEEFEKPRGVPKTSAPAAPSSPFSATSTTAKRPSSDKIRNANAAAGEAGGITCAALCHFPRPRQGGQGRQAGRSPRYARPRSLHEHAFPARGR